MSAVSCVQCKMCVYLDEAVNVLRFLTREKAQNFQREIGASLRKEVQAQLQLPEMVSQSAQGHVGRACTAPTVPDELPSSAVEGVFRWQGQLRWQGRQS